MAIVKDKPTRASDKISGVVTGRIKCVVKNKKYSGFTKEGKRKVFDKGDIIYVTPAQMVNAKGTLEDFGVYEAALKHKKAEQKALAEAEKVAARATDASEKALQKAESAIESNTE